jgi:aerobic-type carbon monoxide dehydrogenase small subunit (CoxS/CutS family)
VTSNFSRRRFIKGVIASSAAAATSSAWYSASANERPAGAVERLVTLTVNGRKRPVDVLPQETLAHTLRYKLGLTGTKLGCNRGECGACTVLVDDINHYACSMLTHSVRGRSVVTVEGLQAPSGDLHPVQQAFIDELAPQCGFCTPGQIMSAVALLKDNPNPSREEARQALSGNLCRCGAYDHYLNAVERAAKAMQAEGQFT